MAHRHVFRARARLSPGHSLLGCLIRKLAADEQQAEAWHWIAVCSGFVCCMVVQFLLWSFWHESIAADRALAICFWFWQCAAFILLGGTSLLGFAAGVEVSVTDTALHVRQGRRTSTWNWEQIKRCEILPALVYYREHAPYLDVTRFMNRIPDDVLLISSGIRYLAIGVSPKAHAVLHEIISGHISRTHASAFAEAARP